MKNILFSILLTFSIGNAFAQKKPKIKSITEISRTQGEGNIMDELGDRKDFYNKEGYRTKSLSLTDSTYTVYFYKSGRLIRSIFYGHEGKDTLNYIYSISGDTSWASKPGDRTESYFTEVHDKQGRIVFSSNPYGQESVFTYNNETFKEETTSIIDGGRIEKHYNKYGHLVKSIQEVMTSEDELGNPLFSMQVLEWTYKYEFDKKGNVIKAERYFGDKLVKVITYKITYY